jgi:predicted site-specific integrase-resolvase
MMTAYDAAKAWGIAPRTVRMYCEQGRVPGAHRDMKHRTGAWLIPDNATKPDDRRKKEKK